ncbi:MAG: protein kinase domain-containing protein [Vulcanimicrobiota bacterium]
MASVYCDKCGFENEDEALFCSDCGERIDSPSTQEEEGKETKDLYKGVKLIQNKYKTVKVSHKARKSIIYKALDVGQNRTVALKEMVDRFKEGHERKKAVEKFYEECSRLKQFVHPRIPELLDFFSENDKYYIVKEYIEGQSLKEMMKARRNRPFPQELAVDWAYQILNVLSYFHSQDPPYFYKNLKASNIMVDNRNQVYLVDYDIDRIFIPEYSEELTLSTRLNPRAYEAPEVLEGDVDIRSDVYSLGIIMSYLLTGLDPEDPYETRSYESVVQINSEVSDYLNTLIKEMTSSDPRQRPNDIKKIQEGLKKHFSRHVDFHSRDKLEDLPSTEEPAGQEKPEAENPAEKEEKETEKKPENRKEDTRSSAKDWASKGLRCCGGCLVAVLLLTGFLLLYQYWIAPRFVSVYYFNRGLDAAENSQFEKALENYKLSLQYKEDFKVYTEMGELYFENNQYPRAIEAWEKAVKLEPTAKDQLQYSLALARFKLGEEQARKGNWAEAEQNLNEALNNYHLIKEIIGDSPAILSTAQKNLEEGEYARALFYYQIAVRTEPESFDARLGRAIANHQLGNSPGVVIEDFDEIYYPGMKLTPRQKSLLAGLDKNLAERGRVYYQSGTFGYALEEVEKALSIDSNNPKALYYKGSILLEQGEKDKGLSVLSQLTNNYRAGSWAQKARQKISLYVEPAPSPYVKNTPSGPPDRSYLPRYEILGDNRNEKIARNNGRIILLEGYCNDIDAGKTYYGEKQGDKIKLYYTRGSREESCLLEIRDLEIFTVEQKIPKTSRGRSTGYFGIVLNKTDGSFIMIETRDETPFVKGEKAYGYQNTRRNRLKLFLPGNNYRSGNYEIEGTGGINKT